MIDFGLSYTSTIAEDKVRLSPFYSPDSYCRLSGHLLKQAIDTALRVEPSTGIPPVATRARVPPGRLPFCVRGP